MPKYLFSNKAVEDLSEIWNYTFDTWSEKQADQYYSMLLENCSKIAENPIIGKNYDGITEKLLGFRAGRHIIFYSEVKENGIEIFRILHEQMDLKNRIDD